MIARISSCSITSSEMDDVAGRAEVGVGTVYRHFPTKEALVEALAVERFRQLAALARSALEVTDPWDSFSGFLRDAAQIQADDRTLTQVMATQPGAMANAARNQTDLHEAVAQLIARAQEAGVLRRDVNADDVPMIMCGLGRAQQVDGAGPMRWRRYLALLLDGMRAPGSSRLPKD